MNEKTKEEAEAEAVDGVVSDKSEIKYGVIIDDGDNIIEK